MAGEEGIDTEPIREYSSGATRHTSEGKLQYIRALSPLVLKRFVEYMRKHSMDGGVERREDNWKKGMNVSDALDSLGRHTMDIWFYLEDLDEEMTEDIENAFGGALFNLMLLWDHYERNMI